MTTCGLFTPASISSIVPLVLIAAGLPSLSSYSDHIKGHTFLLFCSCCENVLLHASPPSSRTECQGRHHCPQSTLLSFGTKFPQQGTCCESDRAEANARRAPPADTGIDSKRVSWHTSNRGNSAYGSVDSSAVQANDPVEGRTKSKKCYCIDAQQLIQNLFM